MYFPFDRWVFIRRRSCRGLSRALIVGCTISACASAAEIAAARELDSIRSKADIARRSADGPPPFRIALNDTFATGSERAGIAKWIRIWNHCRRRLEYPSEVAPPVNAIEAAALQQSFALSRIFQSSVARLIRALYYQELTYGEFARKRYEFTRAAEELSSAIGESRLDSDQARLGSTLQQLLYLRISWNVYLRQVSVRQPGTVHIHGAIFT
jgi:hypothetical protein